jgi:hypothetical protein
MNKVLSISAMARRLGVTTRFLKLEAQAGRIPAHHCDGVYLFNPKAVEEALSRLACRTCESGARDAG